MTSHEAGPPPGPDEPARPLVWLPVGDPEVLRAAYEAGLDVDHWDGREPLPPGIERVEAFVVPYLVGRRAYAPIAGMPRLRLVQTLTAGYDDALPFVPRGVTLCNAPGVHDASTAELAVTLALASLRGVPGFVRAQDQARWASGPRPALADKRVLVVGYGGVGRAVERRLAGFDVEVTRVARTTRTGDDGLPVHGTDELGRLLPHADVVVLCVPLNDATRGLADAEFLAAMPRGALLVNVSRGPVVVTDDLERELRSGRLTAALDVTDPEPLPAEHPLWTAPGLLLTPHVGGNSSAFPRRAAAFLAAQLRRFGAWEPLVGVVPR
jgi:phosphoglycerate dehydrogenase-like enzyme